MTIDLRNTGVIAQKEFADHLYSPSFRILLGVFTSVILSISVLSAKNGCELFNQGFGFIDVAQAITLFLPVLGFALGFDLVIKEKRSKSLNTLLTHPVFRDNIISGKIIGGLGALTRAIDQKIGGFSTGMRKRFGLAQALINEPLVLFLDEPTSGIDPLGAQMMRDLIKDLNRSKGVTVFLSSHSMEEVQEICDRIAIIARGKLLAVGSVEDLRDIVRAKEGVHYLLEVEDIPLSEAVEAINKIEGVQALEIQDGTLHVHTKMKLRTEIAKAVKKAGGTVSMFEEEEMNLQKFFLKIIEET